MPWRARSPQRRRCQERVYVWELPVRLTHWVIFFSILILSATGYYIGHPFISVPGPAKDHFVMGTVRVIHLVCGDRVRAGGVGAHLLDVSPAIATRA